MATYHNQDAKVTLYWLEQSRAQRIVWLLEELEIPYDLKIFKRNNVKQAGPELKQIHPLGKSPVVSIEVTENPNPLILAESGPIVEYLIEHFGPHLIPKRYGEGKEGQIGGETESWLRDRYFTHYTEGSLMALMLIQLMVRNIREAPVPFFIRPVTKMISGKVDSIFLQHNLATHLDFLESQVNSPPGGGRFLCGDDLAGADIMMSYPLEAAVTRGIITADKHPGLTGYLQRIRERDAYKRAVSKIVEIEGTYNAAP